MEDYLPAIIKVTTGNEPVTFKEDLGKEDLVVEKLDSTMTLLT